jgi:5-methylcytosine-specific restriction protein B
MFNKETLKQYVVEYKSNIEEWRLGENREIYKWEAVEHFQKNWNIDAVEFAEMLKVALDKTENLLTVGLFFPKNMLIGLASKEPETVRSMFRNLFDETLDLNKRVSDFMKQSDELHKRNPGGKSHYQGTRSISVYLWLMYPDKYYIYQYAIYDTNVKALEAEYLIKANGKPETMIEGFRFYDAVRDELAKDTELVRLNNKYSLENYKDENLNTLTIDVGFFIYKKNEDNVTWFPSIKEYNPEITVEEWKELYNDNEVFDSDSKQLMNEMMLMDGKATCSQLAETFLGDKSKFTIYNNKFINLGRSIQQKTGKDLFVPKNEDGKNYWSILCVCKKVDKKSDKDIVGQYIFKLRDGLQEALQEMGLPFENVVNKGVKEEQNIMVKYPKNLILYGPPGTGKTYNSVNYAVAIVENKTVDEIKKEDRKAILDRFKQYKEN